MMTQNIQQKGPCTFVSIRFLTQMKKNEKGMVIAFLNAMLKTKI